MTDASTGGPTRRTPPPDPRRRARALAIAAAVLITVAGLFAWFTVDTRLPRDSAAFYAPAILLLTVPLLFTARRLGRDDDAIGPLIAGTMSLVILSVVLLIPIWLYVHDTGSRGWWPFLLLLLLLPPMSRVTAAAVPALVVVAFLAATSRRVWRASTVRRLRFGADGLVAAGIVLAAAVGVWTHPITLTRTGPYSDATVEQELLHAYSCLWRVAGPGATHGFPATLGGCLWHDAAPGSAAYGSGYLLEYHPTRSMNDGRALGFALVTIDAGHRNAESFYLDESGAVRRATGARATAMSPVWVNGGCIDLQTAIRAVEEYRTANPAVGYPLRIARYSDIPDSSRDGGLRSLWMRPSDSIIALPDGSTEVHYYASHALSYRRLGSRYTLSLFSPHSMRNDDASSSSESQLKLLRNFLRDSAGVIHATGEQRPATTADPALSLASCDWRDPLDRPQETVR